MVKPDDGRKKNGRMKVSGSGFVGTSLSLIHARHLMISLCLMFALFSRANQENGLLSLSLSSCEWCHSL